MDPELLDFSTTINPDRPNGVARIYDAALSASRRYPADDYREFRVAAAEYVGCEPRQVIPIPGAMAGLRLTFGVAVARGDDVLLPEPTFGEYAREAAIQGADVEYARETEILDADPAPYAMVVVCNPNNPTGRVHDADDLRAFAERCRDAGTTLLVDEAHIDFSTSESLVSELGSETMVLRALSPTFGLPGLRAAFVVATGRLRERLDVARSPWPISTPAAAVGVHCLEQQAFVDRTAERVASERARMRRSLKRAFDVYPSEASFLLFETGEYDVSDVLDATRRRNIVVRDATSFRGLDSHVRVAVRHPEENSRLLDALAAM